MNDPVVEITSGKVRGLDLHDISAFKGIPYGASMAGYRRFRPPVPVAPWAGVRDALAVGPSSPQLMGPTGYPRAPWMDLFGLSDPPDDNQSEDCLVLNVWTPGLDTGARRPVLFRIHGGGYAIGSGSWNWHDGTNLARRGDVVVVTVNHRLSPLGYLYLDELGGDEYAGSGNAGMLDLVLALEWVRDNVEAFGGDPENVMIFGESGGGMKVSTLLAMPAAAGLFHRAVVQSGPGLRAKSAGDASHYAIKFLDQLGIAPEQLDRLRDLPTQQLLDANIALAGGNPQAAMTLQMPVVDGHTLPAHPGDALASGVSSSIPLLVGATRHEVTHFMVMEPGGLPDIDEAAMRARLGPALEDHLEPVIEAFRHANPDVTTTELCVLIQSQLMMGASSVQLAECKLAGSSSPVYMYMLEWRSPVDARLGAPHGMCVPLTMDNCWSAQWSDVPEARELAARMSQAWINFARDGDPNASDLPEWLPYTLEQRVMMIFDDPCHADDNPYAEEYASLAGVKSPFG